MTRPPLAEVIQRQAATLMRIPGVHAVGEGRVGGEACICIYLQPDQADSTALERVPGFIEGYPVQVRVAGKPSAGL